MKKCETSRMHKNKEMKLNEFYIQEQNAMRKIGENVERLRVKNREKEKG